VRALVVASSVGAAALLVFGVLPPVETARAYITALVALVALFVGRRTLAMFDKLERGIQPRAHTEYEAPAFFERALRRIELAKASGVYFEQLRPRLREIAEQRLAAHGVRLSTDEARELLGAETWEALERRTGGDKFDPPREGELRRMIEALERL
jgi:hypothetical protein